MATIHGSRELSLGGRERPRSRQKVADDEDYEPPEAVRHFPVVLARGHWEVVSGLAHDKRRGNGNLCALRGRREHPNNFFVLARGHWEVVSGLAHDKRRVDGNLCVLRGRREHPNNFFVLARGHLLGGADRPGRHITTADGYFVLARGRASLPSQLSSRETARLFPLKAALPGRSAFPKIKNRPRCGGRFIDGVGGMFTS